MTKYNVMEKQEDTQVRRAQVVYLNSVMNKTIEEIAEIVGYAKSTVRSYINKFSELLEWAKEIFEEVVRKVRRGYLDLAIDANGWDIDTKDGEKCYAFRFFNDNHERICSKVGTTTRTVRQRLKEELRSKTYTNMGATYAIVDRVYDCGEYPAEGLESLIRSEYIKRHPRAFKKNDRFLDVDFDLNVLDNLATQYNIMLDIA